MRHYWFYMLVAPLLLAGLIAGCSSDSKEAGSENSSQVEKRKEAADTNVEPVSLPPLRPAFQTRIPAECDNLIYIADAVAKLELKLWFENMGDGLRVTLGPRPEENQPVYDIASLGPLWKPTSNLVMYGRWNTTSLLKQLGASKELWHRWEETPTGRATKSKDSEDMLGDLNLVLRQLDRAGSKGSMRLNVDDKVEATVRSVGNKPVASLAESNLTQLIPADAEVARLKNPDKPLVFPAQVWTAFLSG